MLNFKLNQTVLEPIFERFKELENSMKELTKNQKDKVETIFPRELRLYRIRIRLAIGVNFSFNTEYALVKSNAVNKTYNQIFRCNEVWFSYEAMLKYCKTTGLTKTNIRTPVDAFDQTTISTLFQLDNILLNIVVR